MKDITLILGGARSGKSAYAVRLAKQFKKVAFIATCQGRDEEMKKRIRMHRESRPGGWTTFEEPKDLASLLTKMNNNFECIIIDCLTLLVSNLMLDGRREAEILKSASALLKALRKKKTKVLIVSNEVGLGIVPANKRAREFRDIAGRVNRLIAAEADDVFFIVSGCPLKLVPQKESEVPHER